MDHLKEGIGLRGYGQKILSGNTRRKATRPSMAMTERIKEDTVEKLCMVPVRTEEEIDEIRDRRRKTMFSAVGAMRPRPVRYAEPGKRWGATTPAPAEAGRSTRSVCGQ
jgi:preprotein translocase subunit SecA